MHSINSPRSHKFFLRLRAGRMKMDGHGSHNSNTVDGADGHDAHDKR